MLDTPELRERDKATAEAFANPQVGDRFSEMYSFWVYVIAVEPNGRVAVMTAKPPCTLPRDGAVKVFESHDAYRAYFAYGSTTPGYWVSLADRGKSVTGWFPGWPEPAPIVEMSDDDGEDSPHPAAFRVLYEAFRALDCTTALDPTDRDDCASVADEAVRALMAAGLLVPSAHQS